MSTAYLPVCSGQIFSLLMCNVLCAAFDMCHNVFFRKFSTIPTFSFQHSVAAQLGFGHTRFARNIFGKHEPLFCKAVVLVLMRLPYSQIMAGITDPTGLCLIHPQRDICPPILFTVLPANGNS